MTADSRVVLDTKWFQVVETAQPDGEPYYMLELLDYVTVVAITPVDECVQTFAYWNPSILRATRLLNPQTGEYEPVQISELGSDVIAGQPAERFRLIGGGTTPLKIDLWYSPARDWLALESRTPEGRTLRYSKE